MDENMKNYIEIFMLCSLLGMALSGCTVSIIMTDTHGVADDIVDSTPTTETRTDADISVPAVPAVP